MKRKSYERVRTVIAAIFLLVTVCCMVAGSEALAGLLTIQPGPAWVKLAAGFTVSGGIMAAMLLGTTFVFGRYFCSVLCPLGAVQDIFDAVRGRRATGIPDLKILRYAIAILALLLLAGGWAAGFRYFDPFSRFGGMLSVAAAPAARDAVLAGLLPAVLLAALVFWKRRIYCVSVCPVGTILGLFAKYGAYGVRMGDSCSGCGLCEKACPTGCADSKSRTIDRERCVLCLKCLSLCPGGAVSYSRNAKPRAAVEPSVDASRRGFLVTGAAVLGAAGIGRVFGGAVRGLARSAENTGGLIFPPGAFDADRFARQCTACQLCTMNCPAQIIKPSPYVFGPVRLEYSRAGCQYDCALCGAVCPSGALQRLSLEDKQWLKVGEAAVDAAKCRVVKDNGQCSLCKEACPKSAIFMMDSPNGLEVPEVAAFHCIGCGVCEAVCPMHPKAVTVTAVEQRPMGT